MSNGMNVFHVEPKKAVAESRQVLERKLDTRMIKERKQGNTTLSYIGGHTVIRLLNEAFDYQWSFEIVSEDIVPSVPKPVFEGYGQNRKAKIDASTGKQAVEEQPPVAKVLGRLTVPGVGVKEQYGSKVIIGGATEQEASFKSASTDALKKCATLFGIGLELYEDDDDTAPSGAQGQQPASYNKPPQTNSTPAPAKPTYNSAPPAQPTTWQQEDVSKLKDLKTILGISDNGQLDPYVREFMDDAKATYMSISPANVRAFNIFLAKKAETV